MAMEAIAAGKLGRFEADKRFSRFKPMEEHAKRPALSIENEGAAFRRLKEGFCGLVSEESIDEIYRKAWELARSLEYSAGDVQAFSIALGGFQELDGFRKGAGIFLSAMMNCCADDGFMAFTEHLEAGIRYLGFENKKRFTVKGDGGDSLGFRCFRGSIRVEGSAGAMAATAMSGGMIEILGDCGLQTGSEMRGGVLRIHGNAGSLLGSDMYEYSNTFPRIYVLGDAGSEIGRGMKGGEIHLERDYASIGEVKGGRIFHRGKLIVDK